MFFLLCCFNGAARCHALVRFYVSLSGSSIVHRIFYRSLREHDCATSTTPEASLHELPYITSLFSNFSQRDYRYSTNTNVFTVQCTNTYIYIQTPLAFNTFMWGLLRLAPITANGVCLHLLVPPLAQCCFFDALA